jgi:hypothetical protein
MREYTFPQAYPSAPERPLHIYRLATPQVDDEAVRAVAGRFRLRAERNGRGEWCESADTVCYTAGVHKVTLYRASGAWRYQDTSRWQRDDGHSHVEINNAAAIEIADRHMSALGLSRVSEYQVFRVTRLNVAVANVGGHSERRIIDVCVTYRRIVDGLPVAGIGGEIQMYIDAYREVTGVDHIWRDVDEIHQSIERLRPPEEALRDLRRSWGETGHGHVSVRAIRLAYYEEGYDVRQQYLQPAYVIPLEIASKNGRFRSRSEHVVPAAVNAVDIDSFTPPPAFHPPSELPERSGKP